MALTTKDFAGQEKGHKLVEITRNTFVKGELAEPGDVVQVDVSDYRVLVGSGKAKPADAGAKVGKAKPEPHAKHVKDS